MDPWGMAWAIRDGQRKILQKRLSISKGAISGEDLVSNVAYLIRHPLLMIRYAFFGMDVEILYLLDGDLEEGDDC